MKPIRKPIVFDGGPGQRQMISATAVPSQSGCRKPARCFVVYRTLLLGNRYFSMPMDMCRWIPLD